MGAITLDNIRRGPSQSAQVGYWIGPEFARQGLMTEALTAVVHHAFAELDLSRIEAACLPENVASRALLERTGFKYEGVAAELPADRRPLAQPRALRQPAERPPRPRPGGGVTLVRAAAAVPSAPPGAPGASPA